MSDQGLGALEDAIAVLHTSIRTKLTQARLEDHQKEHQKVFDVVCRCRKRLALEPAGIELVIHPPPSAEIYERVVVILKAVERAFASELQDVRELGAPYRFRDIPLTLFTDSDVLRTAEESRWRADPAGRTTPAVVYRGALQESTQVEEAQERAGPRGDLHTAEPLRGLSIRLATVGRCTTSA